MRLAWLLLLGTAWAGQLHIRWYTLAEVAKDDGRVIVGKVVAVKQVDKRTRAVELEVSDAFSREAGQKPQAAQPARVTLKEYPGVVWDDPGKSPVEDRVRGNRSDGKVGDLVAAVPAPHAHSEMVTLLVGDAAMLRRLGILFGRTQYGKDPDAVLRADLSDLELAAMARAELKKRGKLDTEAILRGDEDGRDDHYKGLASKDKARFAADAAKLVDKDASLRDGVLDTLLREPDPAVLPSLARVAAKLDPKKEDDFRRLDDVREVLLKLAETGGRLDFSPLANAMVLWEVYRPSYKSDDADLPVLAKHFSRAAKSRAAVKLLENAYTTTEKPDGDPDLGLIDYAAKLAREAPSPAIAAALGKIDPTRPYTTGSKEDALRALMDVALALKTPEARAVIDKWLKKGAAVSDEDRARWKKATR